MNYMQFYDDDDEEEQLLLRNTSRKLRKETDPLQLPDQAFIESFRITKAIFSSILDKIRNKLNTQKSNGVDATSKLASCLIFFAEGRYQHGQDFLVALAQQTFSDTLREVIPPLLTLLGDWIRLEMTPNEKIEAKQYFFQKTGIRDVVMCVDGTHIRIMKPRFRPMPYLNRKKYYSINAMIVCDHKCRIRAVDPRFCGSSHDSYVWNSSPVRDHFENMHATGGTDKLLGDAGYPAEPWLVMPYRDPEEGSVESNFNIRHTKGRNVVERTIGILKTRFRCLFGASNRLNYDQKKSGDILNICCALHNICIQNNIEWQHDIEEMLTAFNE
ncbi:putative nuclease HARBI1 [Anopheles merus]|uniref:putative nuclease HARBI1 n=1 Tax=Anopheles merus TaxID=30066 RepID=UPI001BE4186B|nr:putative nuclease HARBI1 [Anopheles merus]